ncbi:tRNA uridine-5-carboxymethylaminomethyl(34) synthesis GTPase MnmE [Buchnera aphidicola (Muscaphis stroyani)]|uniref:tRNA modification GTPase MnmE n=1 Tax=Buchnera aphidicola (Muscaphis stroyani) TaxID=1241869 RepID=A0A4D6Y4V8_9GAMM|nr:tRNA uridine-5-carboxymethylaminomethyl(34) synthesis GTPase MnmE [Buchnera aphidicola]QCI24139.1 tRNA uridine-5-carboxymethylaminomethyl(34) synthesis GTPase MnmE [Buchnera aphidicola (Muscaphis stroyani)]
MIHIDTIVAQVTAPGKSAVAILRISGSQAGQVAIKILGQIPKSRFANYSKFLGKNKSTLDKGISLWFPSPYSLTGEDVLELQGHGSPLIIDSLMKRILSIKNVRIAKPGEFSERAFLNGKIDLIQAESIDDLINSETTSSMRASLNSLQGDFSFYIKELIKILISLRTHIEASIDFSEEGNYDNLIDLVNLKIKELINKFKKVKIMALQGSLLREEKKIVIAGLPNAGKSSLLNALSRCDRAIVTDVPGTTRDVLYERINISGHLLEIIDTAGLRHTDDEVEKIGIEKAWKKIKESDHVLFVIDKTLISNEKHQKMICQEFLKNISNNIEVTFILNKNDLVSSSFDSKKIGKFTYISISTRTGKNIDLLRHHLIKKEINESRESTFIARRRHVTQLNLAFSEVLKSNNIWKKFKNIELLAESLNLTHKLLGEITGEFTSDDLLDHIFSNFCIGK